MFLKGFELLVGGGWQNVEGRSVLGKPVDGGGDICGGGRGRGGGGGGRGRVASPDAIRAAMKAEPPPPAAASNMTTIYTTTRSNH